MPCTLGGCASAQRESMLILTKPGLEHFQEAVGNSFCRISDKSKFFYYIDAEKLLQLVCQEKLKG